MLRLEKLLDARHALEGVKRLHHVFAILTLLLEAFAIRCCVLGLGRAPPKIYCQVFIPNHPSPLDELVVSAVITADNAFVVAADYIAYCAANDTANDGTY